MWFTVPRDCASSAINRFLLSRNSTRNCSTRSRPMVACRYSCSRAELDSTGRSCTSARTSRSAAACTVFSAAAPASPSPSTPRKSGSGAATALANDPNRASSARAIGFVSRRGSARNNTSSSSSWSATLSGPAVSSRARSRRRCPSALTGLGGLASAASAPPPPSRSVTRAASAARLARHGSIATARPDARSRITSTVCARAQTSPP